MIYEAKLKISITNRKPYKTKLQRFFLLWQYDHWPQRPKSKYINLEVLLLATWGFEHPNFLRSEESTELMIQTRLNCKPKRRLIPEIMIIMQRVASLKKMSVQVCCNFCADIPLLVSLLHGCFFERILLIVCNDSKFNLWKIFLWSLNSRIRYFPQI